MASGLRATLQLWVLCVVSLSASVLLYNLYLTGLPRSLATLPPDASQILQKCQSLRTSPGPPPAFHSRGQSDRFVLGTKPTLLRNGTIWTGLEGGQHTVKGDVLLDGGIIKAVGNVSLRRWALKHSDVNILDVNGAWITPGIIDLHSHVGVGPSPELSGAGDSNSFNGITQPWLRSLDAINTHDASYELAVAGGVTSSLILPGSAGAIGGQAFPIKLRPTAERSASSKLVEPLDGVNSTGWRQLKQACGENPSRSYSGTRMDTIWAFRSIYNEARKLKDRQEAFCSAAEAGLWSELGEYPDDLKYEALADVLRGKVKMQTHCYEAVDFDALVRLSNEFQFSIAAFHHAHEAYLVPDLLKKTWGPTPPALAMFAIMARYKRESFRGSEFASRILNDHNLRVVFKSDHPAIDTRFLLHEAQQGHYYGLPANVSLAAITTTPASVMGLDHRIGYIETGYDADVVVWDSHPLSLGASPIQVYIDGIAQLAPSFALPLKPSSSQSPPRTPDFEAEAKAAVEFEGLPPLTPSQVFSSAVFVNVSSLWRKSDEGTWEKFQLGIPGLLSNSYDSFEHGGTVAVEDGRIVCVGTYTSCTSKDVAERHMIPLDGGSIAPGLTAFGPSLGLHDIWLEPRTNDGFVFDSLQGNVPSIAGGDELLVCAVDGLQFGTRNALLAVRSGVTSAVVTPEHGGVISGLSTAFSLGAEHRLANGAVLQDIVALHVSLRHGSDANRASMSTMVAMLRQLLLGSGKGDVGHWFGRVAAGEVHLVVDVTSADVIATLIQLKSSVESHTGKQLRLTLSTATEAHLLARELGEAGIGVIIAPSRPFPFVWEQQRILPGRPLSEKSAFEVLMEHNVTVALGTNPQWDWSTRNTRFDASWVSVDSYGKISQAQALALVTTNIEKLTGMALTSATLVAYKGGDWDQMESKVVAVLRNTGVVEQL